MQKITSILIRCTCLTICLMLALCGCASKITNPDFEDVACLHVPEFRTQDTTKFIQSILTKTHNKLIIFKNTNKNRTH